MVIMSCLMWRYLWFVVIVWMSNVYVMVRRCFLLKVECWMLCVMDFLCVLEWWWDLIVLLWLKVEWWLFKMLWCFCLILFSGWFYVWFLSGFGVEWVFLLVVVCFLVWFWIMIGDVLKGVMWVWLIEFFKVDYSCGYCVMLLLIYCLLFDVLNLELICEL